MHVYKSIVDPAPVVQAVKTRNGYLWVATPEQAEEVRDKGNYVAIMKSAHKLSKTGEIVPNGFFFTILGCHPVNAPTFTEIPEEVLEDHGIVAVKVPTTAKRGQMSLEGWL